MLLWFGHVLLLGVFFFKSTSACRNECPGTEQCCDDGFCREDCTSSDDGAISSTTLVVIIIFAVVFKMIFWITLCYCRRRRVYRGIAFRRFQNAPTTVVVNSTSTQMQYPAPPQPHYPAYPQNVTPQQQAAASTPNVPPPAYSVVPQQ